jgi:hypothetical protein
MAIEAPLPLVGVCNRYVLAAISGFPALVADRIVDPVVAISAATLTGLTAVRSGTSASVPLNLSTATLVRAGWKLHLQANVPLSTTSILSAD